MGDSLPIRDFAHDLLEPISRPSGTVLSHAVPSNIYWSKDDRWVVIAADAENLRKRMRRQRSGAHDR